MLGSIPSPRECMNVWNTLSTDSANINMVDCVHSSNVNVLCSRMDKQVYHKGGLPLEKYTWNLERPVASLYAAI